MTQEKPAPLSTLTVRGAWHGEVSDPERQFRGTVTASEMPLLPLGQQVTVCYEAESRRVAAPSEHGRYVLSVAGEVYPLASFTCRSAATTGRQGTDDTEAADWQVVVLGAAESSPAPATDRAD